MKLHYPLARLVCSIIPGCLAFRTVRYSSNGTEDDNEGSIDFANASGTSVTHRFAKSALLLRILQAVLTGRHAGRPLE